MLKKYNGWLLLSLSLLVMVSFSVPQAEAAQRNSTLNANYFCGQLNHSLVYTWESNDNQESQITVWEKDITGIYKETMLYDDNSIDFCQYALTDDGVVQTESGFAVPQSEWSSDVVIAGKNMVFKYLQPGETWNNQYQTQDAWGTICSHKSTYCFVGFEPITVMGKQVEGARISCQEEGKVVSNAPEGSEWEPLPYTATSQSWYVEGIGLVKEQILNKSEGYEPYVSTLNLTEIKKGE